MLDWMPSDSGFLPWKRQSRQPASPVSAQNGVWERGHEIGGVLVRPMVLGMRICRLARPDVPGDLDLFHQATKQSQHEAVQSWSRSGPPAWHLGVAGRRAVMQNLGKRGLLQGEDVAGTTGAPDPNQSAP